jgi:hypothetical protein
MKKKIAIFLMAILMLSCKKDIPTQGQLNGLRIASELSIGENSMQPIPIEIITPSAGYSFAAFIINKDGTIGVVSSVTATNYTDGYSEFNLEQMKYFTATLSPPALNLYY